MADFTIYCDDLQEGIWFQELDPHFENAELEVIPSKKAEIMSCGLDEVLKYDRPDIILKDENNVIFVLERTVEVPSGHNVGQRYAAAEANIPIVYFGPYMAYKHGGNTAGPRYMNLRLFYSLKKASELYNTAVTTINWPVDRDCEVLKTPAKDNRIKQYLNLLILIVHRGLNNRELVKHIGCTKLFVMLFYSVMNSYGKKNCDILIKAYKKILKFLFPYCFHDG